MVYNTVDSCHNGTTGEKAAIPLDGPEYRTDEAVTEALKRLLATMPPDPPALLLDAFQRFRTDHDAGYGWARSVPCRELEDAANVLWFFAEKWRKIGWDVFKNVPDVRFRRNIDVATSQVVGSATLYRDNVDDARRGIERSRNAMGITKLLL